MNINLADKLKSLRKEKNVSQEKLAQFLNVSFQAVSKWENGNACPDISLLPDIARFFGITVDELLQVEKINEELVYEEYAKKAWELFRNHKPGLIELWLEAYKKMPNNVNVKEMLMSTYYDTDKIKYKDEIIDLATELCASDAGNYYKGQAIEQAAVTYAENGNDEMADKWAQKTFQLMHCQEVIYSQILHGDEMLKYVEFFTYWAMNKLCYMAFRIDGEDDIPVSYKQAVLKTVVDMYEALYKIDDMSFEDIGKPFNLHSGIAEWECELGKNEDVIKQHLTRAFELTKKSLDIKEHMCKLPLLRQFPVTGTPTESRNTWIKFMKERLDNKCYIAFHEKDWFKKLSGEVDSLLA